MKQTLKLEEILTPDALTKYFFRLKPKYSSLINAALFQGNSALDRNSLELIDTDESGVIEDRRGVMVSVERRRDIVMKGKVEVKDVIFALENQLYDDKKLALRIYGYDYLDYAKQYEEDKILTPVFTVVIYYGEKRIKTRNLVIAIQRLYRFKDIKSLEGLKLTKIAAIVAGRITGTTALIERAYREEGDEVNMCEAVENYYNKKFEERLSVVEMDFNKRIDELLEVERKQYKEQIDTLLKLLETKLKTMTDDTISLIQTCTYSKVNELLLNILDIQNDEDVIKIIKQNRP